MQSGDAGSGRTQDSHAQVQQPISRRLGQDGGILANPGPATPGATPETPARALFRTRLWLAAIQSCGVLSGQLRAQWRRGPEEALGKA